MLFNSLTYLLFLPAVVLLFWLSPARFRVVLLLLASYIFYMSWKPEYGLLILGLTVGNFLLAPQIAKATTVRARNWRLAAVVAANLIVLGIFKYAAFSLSLVHDACRLMHFNWHEPALEIILPLGISFFVFEFIHYAVEVYRGKPVVRSLSEFALFASFFPTQIAGPIKRYEDFLPQVKVAGTFHWKLADEGVHLILLGLFKKVIIADNLAVVAQAGFSNIHEFSAVDLWLVTYAFAFQIFYDFSGYTDIARGSALLFGYRVPINFNLPYLAANISEFWHRWHISLSTWLRDYLFIPLGGSRLARWLTYRNLLITMTLGGLWHGAAVHFVVWGIYHGVLLIVHREYRRLVETLRPFSEFAGFKAYHLLSVILTFQAVCVGWVLFRADDMRIAFRMIRKLLFEAPVELAQFGLAKSTLLQVRDPIIFPALLLVLPVLIAAQVIVARLNGKSWFVCPPLPLQVALMLALLCCLVVFSGGDSPRFIYFQF